MFNKKNEEPSFSVPLSLIANGLVGTYLDYFEGRLTVTLDELALFSIRTLNSIVDELIGKNVN